MTYSFLSDKNINYLQYQLRQIYPEDKWVRIQSSVREAALIWFKQHSADLEMVYQQHGVRGLNGKFINDMVASAEYFDGTAPPVGQANQLFDTDVSDPNIVADQPMPYVTGVENPIFTFSAFSKGFDAKGNPEAKYVYRTKPSYGANDLTSHTLQGPGERSGNVVKYSDFEGSDVSYKALMKPTMKSPYNITDSLNLTSDSPNASVARDGFNRQQTTFTDPDDLVEDYTDDNSYQSHGRPNQSRNFSNRDSYDASISDVASNIASSAKEGFQKGISFMGRIKERLSGNKDGFAGPTREADSLMLRYNVANTNYASKAKYLMENGAPKQSRQDGHRYKQNYGENMKRSIYNTDQPKFAPPAYPGYSLGTIVDEYDADSGSYIPYPNNNTTNTMKTLNQLTFGDVPVVTEMSRDEIAILGSRLYRKKDKPQRQRAPRQDGKCIPRQEYNEQFDDYPTNQPRAKFHLDQIYATPESRINTIMDPVMGKSALWHSQERSVLDIPCSSMTGPSANKAANRYSRQRSYADGTSDSLSVPGCTAFNSVPTRRAYPNRDFVPANYTTNYATHY
jgi:hypothetical protein